MKRWFAILPVLVVLLTAGVAHAEQEVKVKLEDCPKAVQKTIKKAVGDGKLIEIEKETERGKVTYEAEYIVDGQRWEIEVAPNGKLLEKEREDDDDDDDDDD